MSPSESHSAALPKLTLGRIVVLVHDYDAALAFYQAAFGARVLFDAPSPTGERYLHISLAPQGATGQDIGIWLLQARDDDTMRVGRQTGGQPLAVLYATDIASSLARVQEAGGTLVRPLDHAAGASFAHVADLYGNEIVLAQLSALPS